MGSFLPIILYIFSTLFPSPSVFFFHSFFSGPYSLPLPLIFSLPTFFFSSLSFLILILSLALLSALFSLLAFLSPFLPFPSFSLFLRSLFSSMSCLSHASSTPPSLSTLLSSHRFLSQLSFYPSVIHPLPIVSAAFFPYLPYPITLAYHAVYFCTPRLFLLKPCECMLVHSLLNSIAAAWWHEAI